MRYRALNQVTAFLSITVNEFIKAGIVSGYQKFLPLFFILQFFGATIQGGMSDVYKRKFTLILALTILFICSFVELYLEPCAICNKDLIMGSIFAIVAIGGNSGVVGRANLIDLNFNIKRHKVLGYSFFAEIIGWILVAYVLSVFNFSGPDFFWLSGSLALVLLISTSLFGISDDGADNSLTAIFSEGAQLIKSNLRKIIAISTIAVLAELAFYFYFYDHEERIHSLYLQANAMVIWAVPVFLGTVTQMISFKKSDLRCLSGGIYISILGIAIGSLNPVFHYTGIAKMNLEYLSYAFIGFGSGLFLPRFYSIISKGHRKNHQGMVTGWIDSIRTFADASTTIALRIIHPSSLLFTLLASLVLFSASVFANILFFRAGFLRGGDD